MGNDKGYISNARTVLPLANDCRSLLDFRNGDESMIFRTRWIRLLSLSLSYSCTANDLKFNYICNPQRHRVKHREKTCIVPEREETRARDTHMRGAIRERVITVTTYPLLHRIMKPSYRYFRAATVFCTLGARGHRAAPRKRRENKPHPACRILNGIPANRPLLFASLLPSSIDYESRVHDFLRFFFRRNSIFGGGIILEQGFWKFLLWNYLYILFGI